MSSITRTFKLGGVPTDMTSVKLSDPTETYGIKRNDTDAVVVADGTDMTRVGVGQYSYTFADPAYDLTYTYFLEAVYGGETIWAQDTLKGPLTPAAGFSGSDVATGAHSNSRINGIVDNLLTPRLMEFRQITIYDEPAVLMPDGATWRLSYRNWNSAFTPQVRKNSQLLVTGSYSATLSAGTLVLSGASANLSAGDNVNVTYGFDYFPVNVLAGYIYHAVDFINGAAFGSPSEYTISDAPSFWDAPIADLAVAQAMEKLILDYDLWKGRLIFAIPNIEEGGDIIQALETIKSNAEERAYKVLDNERFKHGNYLSPPTQNYYNAVRGGGGRGGTHTGSKGYGKTRGWRINKYS